MTRFDFLVDSYRTERLKTLSVWSQIPDTRLCGCRAGSLFDLWPDRRHGRAADGARVVYRYGSVDDLLEQEATGGGGERLPGVGAAPPTERP